MEFEFKAERPKYEQTINDLQVGREKWLKDRAKAEKLLEEKEIALGEMKKAEMLLQRELR